MIKKLGAFKDFSIATKLIGFIIPLMITLVLIIGVINNNISKNALEKTIMADLENTADLKVAEIQGFYKQAHQNMEILQKMEILNLYLPYMALAPDSDLDSIKAWAKEKLNVPLKRFITTYNYHNIKILNLDGKIIMTTETKVTSDILRDPKGLATRKGKTGIYFSEIFKSENHYIIVVTAPIIQNDELMGIIALEIDMQPIYNLIQDARGLGKTGETLIARKTSKGALFLNPLRHDPSSALSREALKGNPAAIPTLEAVQGNESLGISEDYRTKEVLAVWRFIPELHWGLVAKIDTQEAFAPIIEMRFSLLAVSVIALIIAIFISLRFARYIAKPILGLKDTIATLGAGNTVAKMLKKEGNDEIGAMIDATNNLATFQSEVIDFAKNIGKGKFDSSTDIDESKGELGKSLMNMSSSLQQVAVEDGKRNWTTVGLAKFADILRSNDSSLEKLSDLIVSNLIKYLNANQGSMFVINGEGEQAVLELTASYAWEQKKFQEKKIEKGESLTGRCWQEGATIFLTDIPQNYINITSGLGEANPSCVLIVPMKIEALVYGVIEIASFKEFEKHQIELVEKLAESIASTISSAKVNIRTAKLLEESNGMTEQLQAQEEEMRQNMEEMQATQEEMDRAQREMSAQQSALNNAAIVSEMDLQGNITFVNDEFCKIAGYNREELIGENHDIVRHPDMPKEVFEDLWATVGKGKVWKGKVKNKKKNGGFYWVDATMTPIIGTNGKPEKYIGVRFDITDQILLEEKTKKQIAAYEKQISDLKKDRLS